MDSSRILPPPESPESHRRLTIGIVVIAGLVLAAYWPALQAGYIWDDDDYVLANETLRSIDGLYRIWFEFGAVPQYYPLVHTVFWIQYRLWELNPLGYHTVNVTLHLLSALMLWRILTMLDIRGSWLAAAIFAVHPVTVESAAWVSELKNVLSLFMALLAIAAYLVFRESEQRKYYIMALGFFILALLSKTVACSVPAVLLVIYWWKHGRVDRIEVVRTAPFFAAGLIMAWVTVWMEKTHVGAAGVEWAFSPVDRILIAGRALWFYMSQLLMPDPVMFIYPRWTIDSGAAWQFAFPICFLMMLGLAWLQRDEFGRGPLAALLIYAGVLVPALGFIDVYPMRYSFVADHFQYHAMPAFITLVVSMVAFAVPVLRQWGDAGKLFLIVGSVSVLLACVHLSWRHAHAFADEETLWRDTIVKNSSAWIAYNNLGLIQFARGEVDEATTQFLRVIKMNPRHANARANLGRCFMAEKKFKEAEQEFLAALEIDPQSALTLNNLGSLYAQTGQMDKAVSCFGRILQTTPDAPNVLVNMGNVFAQQKQWEPAEAAYRRALASNPAFESAHLNLALMHRNRGDLSAAEVQYSAGVAAAPNSIALLSELAELFRGTGRGKEALVTYRQIIELDATHVDALYAAGQLSLQQRDPNNAVRLFAAALQHQPNHVGANFNLGLVLYASGQVKPARERFEVVLKAEPEWPVIQERMAWLLAASGEAADVGRAQMLLAKAEKATETPAASLLDCRGVVLAAAGKFNDAAVAAEAAHKAAVGNLPMQKAIAARLALYRSGKPFRQ
jgi:tetratricopeptide (TPR) repeat protein